MIVLTVQVWCLDVVFGDILKHVFKRKKKRNNKWVAVFFLPQEGIIVRFSLFSQHLPECKHTPTSSNHSRRAHYQTHTYSDTHTAKHKVVTMYWSSINSSTFMYNGFLSIHWSPRFIFLWPSDKCWWWLIRWGLGPSTYPHILNRDRATNLWTNQQLSTSRHNNQTNFNIINVINYSDCFILSSSWLQGRYIPWSGWQSII